MPQPIYAIGLKSYIELRRSPKPPRKVTTTITVRNPKPAWWKSSYGQYRGTVCQLTVIDYRGGTFLGTFKRCVLQRKGLKGHLSVAAGTCVELSATQIAALKAAALLRDAPGTFPSFYIEGVPPPVSRRVSRSRTTT